VFLIGLVMYVLSFFVKGGKPATVSAIAGTA
jgi:hypothetical protein